MNGTGVFFIRATAFRGARAGESAQTRNGEGEYEWFNTSTSAEQTASEYRASLGHVATYRVVEWERMER